MTRYQINRKQALFSERLSDARFSLLFYLHGPSRSAGWLSRSQYNLDHHQGNNVLLLPTASGYISTSALLLNPLWQAGIFCILYFCVPYGQRYFGSLTVGRLKYIRVVFMCAWRVINGVRGVYFALLGGKI